MNNPAAETAGLFIYHVRVLQKSEKNASVILSLSKNDGESESYSTLRHAQGDNLGLLQEAHMPDFAVNLVNDL